MPGSKRLIVGLGNPGDQYESTRHNIGFVVIDALTEKFGITLKHDRGDVLLGWGRVRSYPFGVAKPMTYMNRSGAAVRTLLGRHGLQPDEILVVYDDINLEPGRIRLRPSGSAGGHNGIQDIIDRLGTAEFPRLRIGIGDDFSRGQQVNYVLSPFTEEQQPLMRQAAERARDAAITFVTEGLVTAMNRYN